MTTLSAHNLSFSYKKGPAILADLNFSTGSGHILGLAGANGSGKSTLINILAGIFSPTSGELILDDFTGPETLKRLKLYSALLPQNIDHWLLGETGQEDLTLGLDLSKPDTRRLLDEIIARWQLNNFLSLPVATLSLGQKKRLAMAAALARRPDALFLDEPFSGLDWPGTQVMLADLTRLKESGIVVVIVTHEPKLVENLVDDWLLLKRGGEYLFGSDLSGHFEEFGVRPF